MIAATSVVFPAPFEPRIVTISCSRTSIETPCSTSISPSYDAWRSRTRSSSNGGSAGSAVFPRLGNAGSQVGFDDTRVLSHARRWALGDHAPLVEDGDGVGQR